MSIPLNDPAWKTARPPFWRSGGDLGVIGRPTNVVDRSTIRKSATASLAASTTTSRLRVDPRILSLRPAVNDMEALLLDWVASTYEGQNGTRQGVRIFPAEVAATLGVSPDEVRAVKNNLVTKGLLKIVKDFNGNPDGFKANLPQRFEGLRS